MTIPAYELNNGNQIPVVGFGCAFGNWTGGDVMQGFTPEEAWRALTLALEAGFTHFDAAHCYGTERHLGDILGRAMAAGQIRREDLFVTTKLAHPAAPPHVAISGLLTWNWNEVRDIRQRVLDDFDRSKEKLGMGYVDLLLMHWPGTFGNEDPVFAKEARLAIWEVYESLLQRGDAHAIGVCNFNQSHLADLIDGLVLAHRRGGAELARGDWALYFNFGRPLRPAGEAAQLAATHVKAEAIDDRAPVIPLDQRFCSQ